MPVAWLGNDAIGSCGCPFIAGTWEVLLVMVARLVPGATCCEPVRSPGESSPARYAWKNIVVPIAQLVDSLR